MLNDLKEDMNKCLTVNHVHTTVGLNKIDNSIHERRTKKRNGITKVKPS